MGIVTNQVLGDGTQMEIDAAGQLRVGTRIIPTINSAADPSARSLFFGNNRLAGADGIADAREANIAAWARGPIVISPARANTTAYLATHDVTLTRADGSQVLVTGAGTTAGAEPAGLQDGRPLADGTATMYYLGMQKLANDIGAPIVTQGANAAAITAAGLALFDFVAGDTQPVAMTTADAMYYNRTNAYVDVVGMSNGVPPATGNSGVTNASWQPVPIPATGYVYSTTLVEYDFIVEDVKFAPIGGSFGWAGYVLIDGQPLLPNYVTSGGSGGSGVIIDFGGVSKRRKVTIGTFAAAGPQLAGVAVTPQGKVTAVPRNGDVMIGFGDSYGNTVAPNTAPHIGFFLKRYLGVDGFVLANIGTTGYIVKPANVFNIKEVLTAAPNLLLWAYYNPRHVLFNAGGNDNGQTSVAIQAAALEAWRAARTIFPNARISITDGNSGAAGPSAASLATAVALQTAFNTWGDANSRFIPIVSSSATTAWVTGTSHAGQALAAGNSSYWTSTDGTHPSPGGARYLAQRLADAIKAAWAGNY